jgi:hypothetical protein
MMYRPLAVFAGIALVASIAGPARAQDREIGIRIGLTRARLDGNTVGDSKTGFSIGGFLGYGLTDRLAVQAELSYVRKGTTGSIGSFLFSDDFGNMVFAEYYQTVDLDYLELYVPITYRLPIGGLSSVMPRLFAGPAVAVEVHCGAEVVQKLEVVSPGGMNIGTEESVSSGGCEDVRDYGFGPAPLFGGTKKVDFGLMFGGGVAIRLGRGALTGDIRYQLGLVDISDVEGRSAKNRTLEFLVGYAHRIGK